MSAGGPTDIAALLFDKDGTLFDFEATWSAWAARLVLQLAEGDVTRATRLAAVIGFDLPTTTFARDSVAIAGTPDDLAKALAAEMPGMSQAEVLHSINHQAAQAPMAEAVPLKPLLDRFASNALRLGVATNDAEHPAFAHLDTAGIRDFFDFVVGSDSGFGAKPGTGQLLAFCERVSVAPEQTVMVGDSTHDLVAGRNAGMWTAAVLTGIANHEELCDHADVVLPDIGHLPAWLGLA
ncbi:HAD family hydrolase [Marivita sp. S6314]|uniref:HAD family hydrolase n=1 Tax=Marivita sp. S6314 TaxID=2926406 RepID=UPI001FF194B8|nr:HAD family hydrolase [Marivita sp. S6314]MCK0150653.1 HAD family hydrolase [Marivita sp. S6314]